MHKRRFKSVVAEPQGIKSREFPDAEKRFEQHNGH